MNLEIKNSTRNLYERYSLRSPQATQKPAFTLIAVVTLGLDRPEHGDLQFNQRSFPARSAIPRTRESASRLLTF